MKNKLLLLLLFYGQQPSKLKPSPLCNFQKEQEPYVWEWSAVRKADGWTNAK